MCGRYSTTHQDQLVRDMQLAFATDEDVAAVLASAPGKPAGLDSWWAARWNVAPTQPAPVAVHRGDRGVLTLMRWGLVPHWAKALADGVKHINARVETVAGKAPFRDALRRRRCLVAADGFYEWQKDGKRRIPFAFAPADGAPVTFAGIYDRWRPTAAPSGTPWIESFSILTAAADPLVAPLHDRMPLVILPEDRTRWMSPDELPPEALADLLRPTPLAGWERREAEPWVNAATRERAAAPPM
jgi:putative SOS response-associated peptidase YedK